MRTCTQPLSSTQNVKGYVVCEASVNPLLHANFPKSFTAPVLSINV